MQNEMIIDGDRIRHYDNGSYTVNGTYYSDYTKEKAKTVTVAEAAIMAGVTERTMCKWLKNPNAPRTFTLENGANMMDYEVQWFLNNVINKVYPKRTWTKAWNLLKRLCLINRDTLLELLQKRHDEPWTAIQRKINDFDDSHVAAYQRGVKDAMRIAKTHAVQTWDYVPKLGQAINVGGCGGVITRITDEKVFVSGIHIYSNGSDNDPGFRESWRFSYNIDDLLGGAVKPYWPRLGSEKRTERTLVWDYEDIPHNSYA